MQGKGIVKFFLVVMVLVTILQYLYVLPTNRVEKEAESYALNLTGDIADKEERQEKHGDAVRAYLDSMSNETVFKIPLLKSFTYQELKKQQLAMGLDLKGGMSVVLQIDLRDLIRTLAQGSPKDPSLERFNLALEKASEAQKNEQSDFVALFADAWAEVRQDGDRLSKVFLTGLKDDININTTDGEVIQVLRRKANETVELTFQQLKRRVDKLGVVQPSITLDAERDLIVAELPGIENPARARNIMTTAARLEFFDVYRASDPPVANGLRQANERLRTLFAANAPEETLLRVDTVPVLDSTGVATGEVTIDSIYGQASLVGPLFELMTPNSGPTAQLGSVLKSNLDTVKNLLARAEVTRNFPNDFQFVYSQKSRAPFTSAGEPDLDAEEVYTVYGIKVPRNGARLTGEEVEDASAQLDPTSNEIEVTLNMTSTGAKVWADMTTKASGDNQREIAILLDGEVASAPSVNVPITGGSSSITGGFDMEEANDLASILEVGKLPAKLNPVQESVVGPTLGAENIRRSFIALAVGFVIVIAFMMFYYGGAGVISVGALLLNLLFIFGALASLGTVLTLPGFAGIILTIGMAVDANVIIYERIREELREGKSTLMAISDGFKHSYSAIIDANVTTVLTAIVLAYFGLGPIKGFAVVLIIGVLSSLFTAVLVGRLMIDSWMTRRKELSFSTGATQNAFANLQIDWLGKRRIAYAVSLTLLGLSAASFAVRGFELGVDFKGGYNYTIEFAQGVDVDQEELRSNLTEVFAGNVPTVKSVAGANTYNVVTDYLIDAEAPEPGSTEEAPEVTVLKALHAGVNATTGETTTYQSFSNPNGLGTHVSSSSKVGPTIADDITRSAFYAAVFALLLIFLYIFVRFSKWQYSLGAVAALFHDSFIVLGLFSIGHGIFGFNMEIDQAFIAAVLTVIGYSINDTVVVFDRIREYLNTYTSGDKTSVINAAINSTVSRTVITSLTTLFGVLVLFLFGGSSIKGFAFAILIGVIVGTYSSIFVATPLVHDLTGDLEVKKAEERKSFSKAAR